MSYLQALTYKYDSNDADKTLFVIDTNYFLYAYQSYYNSDSFIKALENKKTSVYVPFIVYIEFLSNINSVIESLKSDIKTLEVYMNSIEKSISFDKIIPFQTIEKNLKSNSFSLNSNDFSKLNNLLKEDTEQTINTYVEDSAKALVEKLEEIDDILNQNLKKFSDQDKKLPTIKAYEEMVEGLTSRIDSLLNNDGILGSQYTNEKVNEYTSDMKERYEKNIPPGFSDESKEGNEKLFGNIAIPSEAGDLILWKDLLDKVMSNKSINEKFTNVVIVTNDGLADKKTDWRVKLGNEKIVHERLKIEFYQQTNKNFDLMKVEDFIDNFSDDDSDTKQHIADEIKKLSTKNIVEINDNAIEKTIAFVFLDNLYFENNQKMMMGKIFDLVIKLKNLRFDDLKGLPCVAIDQLNLNSIFDSKYKLSINEKTEVVLGTRLNKRDKLTYISKLFKIAGLKISDLKFIDSEFNELWDVLIQKESQVLTIPSTEIIVYLSYSTDEILDYYRIVDIHISSIHTEDNNQFLKHLTNNLIGDIFFNESTEIIQVKIKNSIENLGYPINDYAIRIKII